MPSACVKVEKQETVSSPESDPIKQMVNLIEKKIRNLEKRKVRLDEIRKKKDSGEELNSEQKEALDKYELVLQSIEFVKELQKGVQQQCAENDKHAKKQQKKEKSEKLALEQRRFRELLAVQALLNGLGDEVARADFRNGTNGAVLLTETELTQLDALNKLISPTREENTNFAQQLSTAAEHIVYLLDGRDKPVATTTYRELAVVVKKIEDCSYFDRQVVGRLTASVTDFQLTSTSVTESINVLPHATVTVPESSMVAPVIVTMYNGNQSAAYTSDAYYTTTTSHYSNGRPIQDIVTSGPFNFIQESEIDPAVTEGAVAYLPQSVYNSTVLVSQPQPIFADPSQHMDVPFTTVFVPTPMGVTTAPAVIMPHYIPHVTVAGIGGGVPVSAMQPIAAETLEAAYAVDDAYIEQASTEHLEKKPFTMNPEASEFQSMYSASAGVTFGTESQIYVNSNLTAVTVVPDVAEVQHADGDLVQQEDDEQEWHAAGGYRNNAGQRGGARGYNRGGFGRGSRRGGGGGFRGRGFFNSRGGRGGYQGGYAPRNGNDFEGGRQNGGSYYGRGRGSYRNGGDKEVAAASPASSSETQQQQ